MSRTKIRQETFSASTLLTPRARVVPATVRVANAMIEGIERRVTDVELPGLVVPGLVDLQVNGWGTRDVREGTVEAVEAIATGLLSHGVTAWLPTIVSCSPAVRLAAIDAVAAARRRQLAGETIGARVLGVHLEGPWIAARRRGAHQLEYLEPPNELSIAQSLTRVPGLVRIVTIAPELDGGLDAIRQVVGAGAVASIGHTDASFLETVDAVNAGARMATHLYNAMRPMHHREPGVVGAVLTDPRVVAGLISDGVHVDPSVVSLVFRAKPERVALVSDVVAGEGSDAARLADGTLAGAYASLSDGVAVAARAGVMLGFAVEAATLTPAETIGARLGRLTPGAFADFVVLDDDLRCVATYLGGERVWSADD